MGRPGHDKKMRRAKERERNLMMLPIAVVAVPIAAPAGASFALWYIASCNTLIVVVINLLVGGFLGLVNGIIIGYFGHGGYSFRSSIVRRFLGSALNS